VELYQNGDVDVLVATDAIGMGLNLDIKHVAFSGLRKFDGRRMRDLMPHELAQIAGRAGRHTNAGTFGVTGEAPPLDPKAWPRRSWSIASPRCSGSGGATRTWNSARSRG
jgi:ATP-dependent RNA helicase SUPV3L1/SUV3